ncbi:MAG: B12-binding domain-containing radical SAM protein [Proteobacteria bacterium]|jgi:radical SAM superfamily enzyme YgiQ (UPF0313 family)|nr:B12-binding domain-containing radical SAM protein [Pseudomonadota bacterium]
MKFTFVIPDMSWLYDYKAQFSLGILYIAAALKSQGIETKIFDTNADNAENIEDSDVFCFSAVHPTYLSCVEIAKKIKLKHNKQIIIGGPAATLSKDTIDPVFDSVFVGQAEDTILDYVKDFENNSIKKFYTQSKNVDINSLLPLREILPISYIKTDSIFSSGTSFKDGGSTSIMFSRGCPFNCAFCSSVKLYNRKINFRSLESIKKEITQIKEVYGIHQFRVQDDTFTINRKYLKSLAELLKDLDIYYRCSTRIDAIDDETMSWLYDSGCREIGIGIEAADNSVLAKMSKGITVEQAKNAMLAMKKYPIKIRQFFMIGLPYDSEETVDANIRFIEETKPDNVVVGRFIPFPGSDMYEHKSEHNIRLIKTNTCMNIGRHLDINPNIHRHDIDEDSHLKIMKRFFDYLVSRNFI